MTGLLSETADRYLELLGTTCRAATVKGYGYDIRAFVRFLESSYPELDTFQSLSRRPHIEAWLHDLASRTPPLKNDRRRGIIFKIRRFLWDIQDWDWPEAPLRDDLIIRAHLPPADHSLPKALDPATDLLLQNHLRRQGDLLGKAILLARSTGLRVGELTRLSRDCLIDDPNNPAVRVPLGKLHTERIVPIDAETRLLVESIRVECEMHGPGRDPTTGEDVVFLLSGPNGRRITRYRIHRALKRAAIKLGIRESVHPHRLRHTYATELIRFGAPLPAVMRLMGHRDVRMTLRYVQVTLEDVHEAYRTATAKARNRYPALAELRLPTLVTGKEDSIEALAADFETFVERLQVLRFDEHTPAQRKRLQRFVERLRRAQIEFPRLLE